MLEYKFDVILDDGSHVPEHQILTINKLWKLVKPFPGIYIIEDLQTSYWKKAKYMVIDLMHVGKAFMNDDGVDVINYRI